MPSAALHIAVILAPFLAMPLAGWLGGRRVGSLLLAAVPAALTGYFAYTFSVVSRDGPFSVTASWAPALNLSLSFRFDGLSLLFAVLITAVGTLIVIYAQEVPRAPSLRGQVPRRVVRLHGVHARPRPERQRHPAVRVLGAHRIHVISAHRVRARPTGSTSRCHAGADRHRRGRPRAARRRHSRGRRPPARRCCRT